MLKRAVVNKPIREGNRPLWADARSLIERGVVLPFVSNSLLSTLLGGDTAAVAQSWAEDAQSPLPTQAVRDLAHVAQYYSIIKKPRQAKLDYHFAIKNYLLGVAAEDANVDSAYVKDLVGHPERLAATSLSEIARNLGYPEFGDPAHNPLRLLAELPLPLYVTTSHHRFLETALADTGTKQPVCEIFYWDDTLHTIPSIYESEPDYRPTKERPLVYHLFGVDKYPESLVISEDDYLNVLIKLAGLKREVKVGEDLRTTPGGAKNDIPAELKTALSGSALLLLDYNIYEWEFRVLFKWLVQYIGESRKGRNAPEGLCMQVEPVEDEEKRQRIQAYLKEFFGQKDFNVYWGDFQSCVHDLWTRWQGRS